MLSLSTVLEECRVGCDEHPQPLYHTMLQKLALHLTGRSLDPLFGKEVLGTEATEVFCRRSVLVASSSWDFFLFFLEQY